MGFHKKKTHKGLSKRVRVTRRGKVLRGMGGHSHLQSTKNAKRRRRLRTRQLLDNPAMSNRIAKEMNVYAPSRRPVPRPEEGATSETPAATPPNPPKS